MALYLCGLLRREMLLPGGVCLYAKTLQGGGCNLAGSAKRAFLGVVLVANVGKGPLSSLE